MSTSRKCAVSPERAKVQRAQARRIALLLWGNIPDEWWNPFVVPMMDAAIWHRINEWEDAPPSLFARWADLKADFMAVAESDPAASWLNCGIHADALLRVMEKYGV